MKARWLSIAVAVALLFAAAMGCSSDSNPVAPLPDITQAPEHSAAGNTHLLGLYQVVIDKATSHVEIVQLRGAEDILNVLSFMEPPPLKNLGIDFNTLDIDGPNNYIGVDVLFTHPFVTPNNDFMGFDVRGVVFGPDVENADGYTPLMNPTDFFVTLSAI